MSEYLLVCSCRNQDKKAVSAFKLLFPGQPIPTIIRGRDRAYKLSRELRNDRIKVISRLNKFAYYVKLGEGGTIIEEWNLTSGRRTG